jgi:hypothetical protein
LGKHIRDGYVLAVSFIKVHHGLVQWRFLQAGGIVVIVLWTIFCENPNPSVQWLIQKVGLYSLTVDDCFGSVQMHPPGVLFG